MMRRIALLLGPLATLAALGIPAPGALSPAGWRVAGVAVWMALWWLTAAVPLEATALLPIVLFPLLGVRKTAEVTSAYADPVIFLFLGGFFLAATLERWDLHRRFALATVRLVGTDAPRVVLAFLLASGFISMWISNTATAVMMLPIAQAVGMAARDHPGERPTHGGFQTALMLSVAYGASIGGVATLIGTPPNAIFAASARELVGANISFSSWLIVGVPTAVLMLAGCWLMLVWFFSVKGRLPALAESVRQQADRLGALGGGERWVIAVFVMTALAWILREPKVLGAMRIPGLSDVLPGISDTTIAIAAALLLFVVPLRRTRFRTALDWETARGVPWGILLLFGGGLALAAAFESSGLTQWVGGRIAGLRGAPLPLIILVCATLFIFLTELTSNTATATLGMPLLAGVAGGLGMAPVPLMATGALASSMAFMLPVATPPNAIVFGSGWVSHADMARAGFRLNLISIAVVTLIVVIWTR